MISTGKFAILVKKADFVEKLKKIMLLQIKQNMYLLKMN